MSTYRITPELISSSARFFLSELEQRGARLPMARGRDAFCRALFGTASYSQAIVRAEESLPSVPDVTDATTRHVASAYRVPLEALRTSLDATLALPEWQTVLKELRRRGVVFVVGPAGSARRDAVIGEVDRCLAAMRLDPDEYFHTIIAHRHALPADFVHDSLTMHWPLESKHERIDSAAALSRIWDLLKSHPEGIGFDGADDAVEAAGELIAARPQFAVIGCGSREPVRKALAYSGWGPGSSTLVGLIDLPRE